ncbi:MAG: alpha/beta hydrolase [Acidimicrobiales bacterium]|nr:alpha/beta hydrolase [Acidimicrobiales bacterium]
MATTVRIKGAEGVEIASHHLGGDGPPVMLVHATGFHGRSWEPLATHLDPAFSVWALDQRGHGASGKSPDGRYDWDCFVEDLLAVIDGLGLDGWRGLGHSLGGAVLLMAEARRGGTFSSLCCYEPVVMPPDWAALVADGAGRVSLAELARKRRPSFPSRQAALDNYRSKPPFGTFQPDVLDAYVEYGFVDEPDGSVTLACRREDEASVFEGALSSGAWGRLRHVRCPVAVLGGADLSNPVSRAAEQVARQLPQAGYRRFEELDHFGPMVDPAQVAGAAALALGQSTNPVTPPS